MSFVDAAGGGSGIHYAKAADVLSIVGYDVSSQTTTIIGLQDSARLASPIKVSASDALVMGTPDVDPVTGLEFYPTGLGDSASVKKSGQPGNHDRLTIGDVATVGVVRLTGINLSASDTVTFTESTSKVAGHAGDTLTLGDMAICSSGKPATDTLYIGDHASVNVIRNLSAADVLVVEESTLYFLPYALTRLQYQPFVGTGPSSNPTPPPATLSLPSGPDTFTLFWPPTGTPSDTLVLRKPEFGNKDRLQFNRVSRETRGGTLIVFADPMWPKTETQVLTFSALTPAKANALIAFMEAHLGLQIGMWDWEGRQWTGIITNPNDPIVQDSKYSFTGSLEFEGTLV